VLYCIDIFGPERLSQIILVDQSPFLTADPHWTQQELEDAGAFDMYEANGVIYQLARGMKKDDLHPGWFSFHLVRRHFFINP
jgi:hypothetical protein